MGVKREIYGFTLPLGATINMDGTAIYMGLATVLIAQFYGISLTRSPAVRGDPDGDRWPPSGPRACLVPA